MQRFSQGRLVYYRWKVFESWNDRFTAVITTRKGGISRDHLADLNLGHSVNESIENLHTNRREVAAALNLRESVWSVADQVHRCNISQSSCKDSSPHPETDALELAEAGIIAAVMLADCHPVILYDPIRHISIVCHAGWKGTAAGIADRAVRKLISGGSIVDNLVAATGPGIGPCCYQVDKKVHSSFNSTFAYPEGVFTEDGPGKWRLDIEAANMARLRATGIREDRLGGGGFCTACRSNEFYSYRKEKGLTGRQAAMVALLP